MSQAHVRRSWVWVVSLEYAVNLFRCLCYEGQEEKNEQAVLHIVIRTPKCPCCVIALGLLYSLKVCP